MAVFAFETPRWLQPARTDVAGKVMGTILAGATNYARRKEGDDTPFLDELSQANLNQQDPFWKLKVQDLELRATQAKSEIVGQEINNSLKKKLLDDTTADQQAWADLMTAHAGDNKALYDALISTPFKTAAFGDRALQAVQKLQYDRKMSINNKLQSDVFNVINDVAENFSSLTPDQAARLGTLVDGVNSETPDWQNLFKGALELRSMLPQSRNAPAEVVTANEKIRMLNEADALDAQAESLGDSPEAAAIRKRARNIRSVADPAGTRHEYAVDLNDEKQVNARIYQLEQLMASREARFVDAEISGAWVEEYKKLMARRRSGKAGAAPAAVGRFTIEELP